MGVTPQQGADQGSAESQDLNVDFATVAGEGDDGDDGESSPVSADSIPEELRDNDYVKGLVKRANKAITGRAQDVAAFRKTQSEWEHDVGLARRIIEANADPERRKSQDDEPEEKLDLDGVENADVIQKLIDKTAMNLREELQRSKTEGAEQLEAMKTRLFVRDNPEVAKYRNEVAGLLKQGYDLPTAYKLAKADDLAKENARLRKQAGDRTRTAQAEGDVETPGPLRKTQGKRRDIKTVQDAFAQTLDDLGMKDVPDGPIFPTGGAGGG